MSDTPKTVAPSRRVRCSWSPCRTRRSRRRARADGGIRGTHAAQRAAALSRRDARPSGADRRRAGADVHRGRGTRLHGRVRRAGHAGAEHGALGHDRRPHRPRQPPRLSLRAARPGARAGAAVRHAGVAAHDRHRRLQGAERHLRPPGRRRSAAPARPACSQRLRRDVDLPARYGGEEFAVILPNTPPSARRSDARPGGARADARGAARPGARRGREALAERLRRAIAAREFR